VEQSAPRDDDSAAVHEALSRLSDKWHRALVERGGSSRSVDQIADLINRFGSKDELLDAIDKLSPPEAPRLEIRSGNFLIVR
jgi:hypothetical protein